MDTKSFCSLVVFGFLMKPGDELTDIGPLAIFISNPLGAKWFIETEAQA